MDITVCGSGAAYAIDRGAPCTKPPCAAEPGHRIIHPFHQNKGDCSQFCPPVIGKFTHLHTPQSNQRGFIQGCPNISKKLVLKYLNPSPAMAKGHMKRPCNGVQSTTPKTMAKPPMHVINMPQSCLYHPHYWLHLTIQGEAGLSLSLNVDQAQA